MDCSPLDSVSSTAALPFFHVVARAGGGGGRGGSGGMGGAGGGMGSESAWDLAIWRQFLVKTMINHSIF